MKKCLLIMGEIILIIAFATCIFLIVFLKAHTYTEITFNNYKNDNFFTQSSKEYVSPIDFDKLHKRNKDVFAWIEIDSTKISYPIVFNKDNDKYYLRRNLDSKYTVAGTLFIEKYNHTDFNDPVTLIYGHNMPNGEMFGMLQDYYSNADTFKKYNRITVYFPDREYHYTVFAAVPWNNINIVSIRDFSDRLVHKAFFDDVYSVRSLQAVLMPELRPTENDKVIVLSTCLNYDNTKRFLVMAVRDR